MGIKFQSPLELSAHRAIAHSDSAQVLIVKVVTKTAAHPEYGNGSSNGYTINGIEGAYIELTPGNTYKFDQSDSSNNGHPLRFYEDAAKTTAYTTGVTTNGTPGTSGAYTQIIPTTATLPILFYQCSAHSLMGSYAKFGTGTIGDTYSINATQDGDNVDIKLDAASGTDSTVQLTAGDNITLTRNNAQEVTIASTASGGGTVTVEKNVYTGDGSDVTFNTTTAIANENNVQVYIDGVYQSKDNYTTSGNTVTMSTAPPNTTSVELIHMVAVDGVIARDSFTGNGSTTAYVLSMSISNENATQVYLDGVYQSKDNYSTSSSTLTFSTAPPNGTAIEVVHIKAVDASSLNQNNFTGDGSTTAFTLSQSITDEAKTFVFIQGVYQEKSTYGISGTTLTFTTAPQNGYTIEVMAFSTITIGNQATGTNWQSTIQTSNFTAEVGKGYFVNTTSAEITVTLPAGIIGEEIVFQDYTGTFATNIIIFTANGSEKIQGSTDDYKCATSNARVNLVYQDATEGWTATNIETNLPPLAVDYLVVGGGGGGGAGYYAGGGGAGGYRTSYGDGSVSALSLNVSTNYTVTVGAGGAAQSSQTTVGNSGNNSVFATITSAGGGGGGSRNEGGAAGPRAGLAGGSGGGTAYGHAGGAGNTPSVTPSQGNAGGQASSGNSYGSGGGGASAAGGGTNTNSDGGAGTANSITGSSVTYAGGGAGGGWVPHYDTGTGGTGGGGNGGDYGTGAAATAGTANTGGGGGGGGGPSGSAESGAAGGSGVVILRYPNAYTISGLSGTTITSGTDKITTFTNSGTITFSS